MGLFAIPFVVPSFVWAVGYIWMALWCVGVASCYVSLAFYDGIRDLPIVYEFRPIA